MTPATGSIQKYWAIIPAAGVGRRMQDLVLASIPKQYMEIQGRTILELTLARIDQLEFLSGIILVLAENDGWYPQLELSSRTSLTTAAGGATRADSVANGLLALADTADNDDWVLVHDVVRPCVSLEDINKLVRTLSDSEAGGLLAAPVRETLKKAAADNLVDSTVPRQDYWLAGTPQMFRYGLLKKALEKAQAEKSEITDEAQAMENAGYPVNLVQGRADNIKITHGEDLLLAEYILDRQNHD